MVDVTFALNGHPTRVAVSDTDNLLHVLRNRLELRGTRFGCGLEQCGSCMVLVDGTPTYACTYTAGDLDGKAVTTVEGLGSGDDLHPVQRAFLDEQAGQCGYCLSGIVISVTALLKANPAPDYGEIVAALDRHLCRCGAHRRMLRAVDRAAAALRGEGDR